MASPGTSGGGDFELLLADTTTWLPLSIAPPLGNDGLPTAGPKTFADILGSQNAGTPIQDELIPLIMEDWSGGLGVDYNAAEAVYTRTPGYALPAGAYTAQALPASPTTSPLVQIIEYGDDLFVLEEGTASAAFRVLRSVGGTGTGGGAWTVTLGNATAPATGAGEIGRGMVVFDGYLYVSSTATDGQTGRLWRFDGTTWTATAAGTFAAEANDGRNKLAKVYWTGADGVGGWRMVSISGTDTIAYTEFGGDPFTAADWVSDVRIETNSHIDNFATARRHVWVNAKDELFDLNELGESPSLTGYTERAPSGLNFPVQYYNGFVYRAAGAVLDRIRVEDGPVLQEKPGNCAPGFGTAAENEWRGYVTAMGVDQGYLVAAVWNPTTGRTGLFWGLDRPEGVQTRNPLLWYGPEVVSAGNRRVTALLPSTLAGDRRLWIASLTGTGAHELIWVSLPVAGAPIQDLISAGTHRYATGSGSGDWQASSRLLLRDETLGDKASVKHVFFHTVGSRAVGSGTNLTLYTRFDPAPSSTAWGSGDSITEGPTFDVNVSTTISGYKLERRLDFISPSGGATPAVPAVLDSLRTLVWMIAPDRGVRDVTVMYGSNALDLASASMGDTFDPDWISAQLVLLTRAGRTRLRDRAGKIWSIKLSQYLPRETRAHGDGPWHRTIYATLRINFVQEIAAA